MRRNVIEGLAHRHRIGDVAGERKRGAADRRRGRPRRLDIDIEQGDLSPG
jgi:hypothetical protein